MPSSVTLVRSNTDILQFLEDLTADTIDKNCSSIKESARLQPAVTSAVEYMPDSVLSENNVSYGDSSFGEYFFSDPTGLLLLLLLLSDCSQCSLIDVDPIESNMILSSPKHYITKKEPSSPAFFFIHLPT